MYGSRRGRRDCVALGLSLSRQTRYLSQIEISVVSNESKPTHRRAKIKIPLCHLAWLPI